MMVVDVNVVRQLLMKLAASGREQFTKFFLAEIVIDCIIQYLLPRWHEIKEYSGFDQHLSHDQ